MKKKCIFTLSLLLVSLVGFAIEQLTLGSYTYTVDTLENYKAGPGTQYTSLRLKSGANRIDAFFLKVDLTNPYIQFNVGLGCDSIYRGERPSEYGARKTTDTEVYIGGTNGDFYQTGGTDPMGYSIVGLPIGATMTQKQISHTPNNTRRAIGFSSTKEPITGTVVFSGEAKNLTTNETYPIKHVNYVRYADELVFYNDNNGKITRTNKYGSEVVVSLVGSDTWGANKTVRVKVESKVVGKGSTPIPAGKGVLSGHGAGQTFVNALNIGDELELTFNLTINGVALDYTDIISGDGRPEMLKDGVVETDQVWNELHPRTGIGYSQDKKTIYQCVVDGRGASRGATTLELAQLMKASGAYTAVNLDGGGSSCLWLKDMGPQNRTSDGTERSVSNNISAVAIVPGADTTITSILTYNTTIKLPRYGVYMPKVLGYNQYGILMNKDIQKGITLSCTPEMGHIETDGRFVASGTEGGILTVTYNGTISTTVNIVLVTEAEIALRLDSVLISNKRPYPIEIRSIIGKDTLTVLPKSLTWQTHDSNVCTIDEEGTIIGHNNGKTSIVGNLGSFKDTLIVTVENTEYSPLLHDDFENADNWEITAQSNWNTVLSKDNVPASWPHGGALNYTYQTSRAPNIKLTHNKPFYSLPDSMRIYLNSGDIAISKMYVGLKANCDTKATQVDFLNIPSNSDQEYLIDFSDIFNTNDFAIYPLSLDYITFYIKVSSQTVGVPYALAMRDVKLYYAGVPVSLKTPRLNTALVVYPNPVTGGEAIVKLNLQQAEKVRMEVINLQGQIVKHANLGTVSAEAILPLQGIPSGSYFVRLIQESKTDIVKLLVK